MVEISEDRDGRLVAEITRVMLGRFGRGTLAMIEAIERRCLDAGDVRRARIMGQVRQRISGGHLIDLVV